MRKLVLALAAILAAPAAAIPPLMGPPPPAPPPRLIVVVSVDQLSSDLWDEYRPQFTGGFARLAQGAVFRNGYQAHNASETCPGHSTITTGAHPARTGIIANIWFDPSQSRSDKAVYCAEDERVPGTSSTAYTVSPYHLRVPTLGDRLKALVPASRNVAVGGKDRSAVMMSGRNADQRWYWDGKKFATDLKRIPLPRSAAGANAAVARMIAAPGAALDAPPFCQAKARAYPVVGVSEPVGTGRFARPAGDATLFRASPAFDGATLALAAALVEELQLGRGSATTDMLSVGLAATDYVGHKYGTRGLEMCLQLLSLDRELGDFFGLLDRTGVDYAVALTSDHGGDDIPERLRAQGVGGAARVDPALAAGTVGKAIASKLGLGGQVLLGDSAFGDIYLDRRLNAAQRSRVLAEAAATYRAHPQVEAAFTREQLQRTALPTASPDQWTVIERARASFDAERSGDLVVVLKPHITPIAEPSANFVATHGSPWDYDRRVPILFWRKGMAAAASDRPVMTVDIMPTLAAMLAPLGLQVDSGAIDGRCLQDVPGVACVAASRPNPERGQR